MLYNKLKTILLRGCTVMAYIITDACIACGACESECPVGAISEGAGKYEIDADACLDCGACQGVCPVDAPQPE
jgi:ferredoxin